jgi:phage FluMu protein Com
MPDRVDTTIPTSRVNLRRHVLHLECPKCRKLSRLRIELTNAERSTRTLRSITCSRCERLWAVQLERARFQRMWEQANPSRVRIVG